MRDFSREERSSMKIIAAPAWTVRSWETDDIGDDDTNWTRYGLFLDDELVLKLDPHTYVDTYGDGGTTVVEALAYQLAKTIQGVTK